MTRSCSAVPPIGPLRDALIIGGASVVTAVLGSLLADVAPERVLKVGFAVLLLYVAWRLFRSTLSRGTA